MKITDIDWRQILNSWPPEDIRYLKAICEEKLAQMHRRKILITKEED